MNEQKLKHLQEKAVELLEEMRGLRERLQRQLGQLESAIDRMATLSTLIENLPLFLEIEDADI